MEACSHVAPASGVKLPEHEGNTQVLRAFDVSCPSVGELKLNENNITAASAVLAHSLSTLSLWLSRFLSLNKKDLL